MSCYLAQIEDCYISAAELGRLTGLPQDLLLRNELPLLEALNFDFIIFSPYRAIDGLVEVRTLKAALPCHLRVCRRCRCYSRTVLVGTVQAGCTGTPLIAR